MTNDAQLKELVHLIVVGLKSLLDIAGGINIPVDFADAVALIQSLPPVLKDLPQMLPEYLALDEAARADMEAYVAANVVIPENSTVQAVVQQVLNFAIQFSSIVQLLSVKK